MIRVTRLDHSSMVLNCDLIAQIESTPDTVISLTGGERIMVRESTEELVARVVEFRRSILLLPARGESTPQGAEPRGPAGEAHGR